MPEVEKNVKKYFVKVLTRPLNFAIILLVAARAETNAAIAQSVEHVIGNDEVIGPNPISSSKVKGSPKRVGPFGLCRF